MKILHGMLSIGRKSIEESIISGDEFIGHLVKVIVMLYTNCHRQTYSKAGQQIQDVSKLLEPYAG